MRNRDPYSDFEIEFVSSAKLGTDATLTSLFEGPVTTCGQSQPLTRSTPAI